ncbi:DUF2207 domain-containing protein, partial [Candidatus Bipolaricaulota bacterium]|nr:DUF2207 domain-containing protein [Candidatus Bipolaricaulota bacterium]
MMRIGRTFSIACLLLISLACAAAAELRIQDFAVDILADVSGQLTVTENITVRFITPHHGIERFIAISGKTQWGENVRIDLQLEEIRLDDGPVPYTTSTRGSNRVFRIGDPDRTITGTYEYSIRYRVDRAWLFDENALRLYWNVTGNEWDIPIEHASAVVRFPDSVDLVSVSSISYLGYYGNSGRGTAGEATETGELVFQSGLLYPGEGMTIDVSIPREMLPISPPTVMQRIGYFLDA